VLDEKKCGIQIEEQTAENIADQIVYIMHCSEEERMKMGERAKEAAKEFDFNHLTDILYDCCEYSIEHYQEDERGKTK
jgi:hypothetical protein